MFEVYAKLSTKILRNNAQKAANYTRFLLMADTSLYLLDGVGTAPGSSIYFTTEINKRFVVCNNKTFVL